MHFKRRRRGHITSAMDDGNGSEHWAALAWAQFRRTPPSLIARTGIGTGFLLAHTHINKRI
jgi:hypothetical protein